MTSFTLTDSMLVRSSGTSRALGRFLKSAIKPLVIAVLTVSAAFMILMTAVTYLPTLAGLKTMIVTSGSMEPNIGTGSAILIEESRTEDIQIGDVISFEGTEGHLVTHRVVAIKKIKGEIYFQTLGDANLVPDPNLAPAGAVVGRVKLVVPHMGYMLYHASGKWATIAKIGLPAILLMGFEIRSLFKSVKEKLAESNRRLLHVSIVPDISLMVIPGMGQSEPMPEYATIAPPHKITSSISAPEYWASAPTCGDRMDSSPCLVSGEVR